MPYVNPHVGNFSQIPNRHLPALNRHTAANQNLSAINFAPIDQFLFVFNVNEPIALVEMNPNIRRHEIHFDELQLFDTTLGLPPTNAIVEQNIDAIMLPYSNLMNHIFGNNDDNIFNNISRGTYANQFAGEHFIVQLNARTKKEGENERLNHLITIHSSLTVMRNDIFRASYWITRENLMHYFAETANETLYNGMEYVYINQISIRRFLVDIGIPNLFNPGHQTHLPDGAVGCNKRMKKNELKIKKINNLDVSEVSFKSDHNNCLFNALLTSTRIRFPDFFASMKQESTIIKTCRNLLNLEYQQRVPILDNKKLLSLCSVFKHSFEIYEYDYDFKEFVLLWSPDLVAVDEEWLIDFYKSFPDPPTRLIRTKSLEDAHVHLPLHPDLLKADPELFKSLGVPAACHLLFSNTSLEPCFFDVKSNKTRCMRCFKFFSNIDKHNCQVCSKCGVSRVALENHQCKAIDISFFQKYGVDQTTYWSTKPADREQLVSASYHSERKIRQIKKARHAKNKTIFGKPVEEMKEGQTRQDLLATRFLISNNCFTEYLQNSNRIFYDIECGQLDNEGSTVHYPIMVSFSVNDTIITQTGDTCMETFVLFLLENYSHCTKIPMVLLGFNNSNYDT